MKLKSNYVPALAVLFTLFMPLIVFVLLWLKGLPSFAVPHPWHVLFWIYGATWVPALMSGLLVTVVVSGVIKRTRYFHRPYDFGRCFSLGAITGALTAAFATWTFRSLTRHPFSDFWIAGGMIAGCLAGAFLSAFILWLQSRLPNEGPLPPGR